MVTISEEFESQLDINNETKINPYIADDLNVLKKNYSILLDYVIELESRLRKKEEKINFLNRRINYFEMKEKGEI